MPSKATVSLVQLQAAVMSALTRNGLPEKAARSVAKVVADAERDGATSHGIFRVPGFLHALRNCNPTNMEKQPDSTFRWREPAVADTAPGLVSVDAFGGFAAPAFEAGRSLLVEKARRQGVACMAVSRTRHFSALWWEVERLAEDGLVSLALVNSAAFVAHGPGARTPVYGTNPIAFGCPRPYGLPPLVFDQATAAMARGEMQLLHRAGLKLPPGVAIDAAGEPTEDPFAALNSGAQLPAGAHKGANLALLVEVLAAGLTKSPFAPEAREALEELKRTTGDDMPLGDSPTINGELVIALDPACFFASDLSESTTEGGGRGGRDSALTEREREGRLLDFSSRVESFLDLLLASGATEGQMGETGPSSLFRLPGSRRHQARSACEARGFMVDVDAELLRHITEDLGQKQPADSK